MEPAPARGSFAAWTAAADAVRRTTKRNEKLALLGAYLGALADLDLAIAARFFAGGPFARTDERVLGLGEAAIAEAIRERTGDGDEAIAAAWRRHADAGDLVAELLAGAAPPTDPLALTDVAAAFREIAAATGTADKRSLLRAVLVRADAAEARYLVKLVGGEMRIGLREGLLEDALARAFRCDRAAIARANMLGGDIGIAALQARRGTLGDAHLARFVPVGFMLATPVTALAEVERRFPPPYVVEDKYDGVRTQAHKSGDRVELYSRTADRVTDRFPEVVEGLREIEGSFVVDAEILAFDGDRAVPFTAFQRRLGRKVAPAAVREELPASLVVFDLLERDGRTLLDLPLAERQAILRTIAFAGPIRLARGERIDAAGAALEAALESAFGAARGRGNEGLMVKDPRSPYRPGRRGMEWLKIKRALRTLDVVVTAVEWGRGKRRGVLSDYTFAVRDGDRLRNVGKAYSGLTDREIAEMTEHFLAHTIRDRGHARLVDPDTVIEVAFDQIQTSARHESGYALRFPRIVRLRPDKPVSDIDTLQTVRGIAEDST